MDWLVLLLVIGSTAPQTIRVEPVATEGSVDAAASSGQARGRTTSDRSDAISAITRLQIARRAH